MGEVTEKRARHYTGLVADKATIPAGGKEVGDGYYATDTKKQYYWDGAAWSITSEHEYVPRKVHAVDDFVVGNFTTDGDWKVNGLNLTGVVPVGTIAVVFRIDLTDDAADSSFNIRQNDTDAARVQIICNTQVANIAIYSLGPVGIDADRLMDYIGKNLVFTTINVNILGYFI